MGDRSAGPTPCFDELYDCAKRLGRCEVVLRRASVKGRAPVVILAVLDGDGDVVHEAGATQSVEDAAKRIRRKLEHDAARRGGET